MSEGVRIRPTTREDAPGISRLLYQLGYPSTVGRLLALAVDADARSRGIGAALMRETEEWIAGCEGAAVVVNSGDHRVEAHRFYERHGYSATGVRFIKDLPRPGESAPASRLLE